MQLTPLEADVAGDMAQDDHAARELVAFVRLHHGDEPLTVRRVARDLLATWYARAWLEVVNGPPERFTYRAATVPELLRLLDGADLLTVTWPGADTWLRLTEKGETEYYSATAAG